MFAKQPIYFAEADAAGLVGGARVPILLTNRVEPAEVRTAPAVLVALMAAGNRKTMDIP